MAAFMGKDVKKLKAKGGGKCTYISDIFFPILHRNLSPETLLGGKTHLQPLEPVQISYLEEASLTPEWA